MTSGPAPAIRIRDLRLRTPTRTLLEGAGLDVREGELCLLVGASGTGKSLTLGLLAGLLRSGDGLEVSGTVEVLGQDPLASGDAGVPGSGVLFQDFALFDDLDARGNVLFGVDHGAHDATDREARADALLDEFGLPADLLPARMSGGMRQRLALARALGFGPRLLFYDEPTSGLDPALSRRVAERIRRVHDDHSMTSVVVTHDLTSLLDVADRVIFLDPEQRSLRDVEPADVDATLAALRDFQPEDEPVAVESRSLPRRVVDFLEAAGGFVIASVATLASLFPRFPRPRWGMHQLWYDLRLVSLGTALPFLALAGLISGFIATYFMFSLLPLRGFTEPVLIEDFLGSLGFALYRVVVPVVTCLLFASRSGAAIAADVGNRNLTRQLDALRSHGVTPGRYLLTGISLASLLGMPVLFVVAYVLARVTATGVFLATHPGFGSFAFNDLFDDLLGSWGPLPGGTLYVVAKILICALGTAGIAYHVAIRPKRSGAEVARGVTDAIIRATIFVLVVHTIFAFFEF